MIKGINVCQIYINFVYIVYVLSWKCLSMELHFVFFFSVNYSIKKFVVVQKMFFLRFVSLVTNDIF